MGYNLAADFRELEELQKSIKKAIQICPDKAKKTLQMLGKDFKKKTIKETRGAIATEGKSLVKGYRLSRVKGSGENFEVDFRGTAPHFHLVELGHNMVVKGKKGGRVVGYVPGKLIVKKVRTQFTETMIPAVEAMCDEVLKESGLEG